LVLRVERERESCAGGEKLINPKAKDKQKMVKKKVRAQTGEQAYQMLKFPLHNNFSTTS